MLRTLKKEVFYAHSPQRVWQVITNRDSLAVWLMANNFELKIGHKFQFQDTTLPGINTSIDCEIIEIDEPRRLSYTWKDGMMSQSSVVTWILKPGDGGTYLRLEHRGLNVDLSPGEYQQKTALPTQSWHHHTKPKSGHISQGLLPAMTSSAMSSIPMGRFQSLEGVISTSLVNGGWEYRLMEKLPQALELINLCVSTASCD